MASISVDEAMSRVLQGIEAVDIETVSLADAHGRVLASDITALRSQPPADVSAMDGYAVRAQDVTTIPARLTLVGEVTAGWPLNEVVGPGQAVRIFTGGVVPQGADTIIIQEHAMRDGDSVVVGETASRGRYVRAQGLDFAANQVLLPKGHRLTDRDLALAAAMNHPNLSVYRRPKVALFASGDELIMPGTAPAAGQIVSSNVYALSALVRAEGAEPVDLGIVRDSLESTTTAITRACDLKADILVSTGGASVGEHDLIQKALIAHGMDLAFWRVALRPGRPMMHGALGTMRVLGVPGNPVSSYVCGFLFLVPMIRRLSGRIDLHPPREQAILGKELTANDERTDYLRALLTRNDDGSLVATPHPVQDSSMLTPLAKANCLVIREPYAPHAAAGTPCTFVRLGA